MALAHDLSKYPHPYVTVDGVLFRARGSRLEVKLIRPSKLDGTWALPGGFVAVDKLAIDTLRDVMAEKAGISGFYAEQLQTYDALDRDERGRVLSIAYLCLTNDWSSGAGWFSVEEDGRLVGEEAVIRLDDLGFDHGQIIRDAKERMTNKLWYSDLLKYLLPESFPISDVKKICEMLEGSHYGNGFQRNLDTRVVPTGEVQSDNTPGVRARLFRWGEVPRKNAQKGVKHVIR